MPPSFAGGIDRLLTLLASGVPVGEEDGYAPLVVLAAKGPLAQFQLHVEGQEPAWNQTSSPLQITPLMASASAGQTEIMEFLLRHGAALDQTDSHGRTALFYAVIHNQVKAVQLLLAHPLDPNRTDNQGRNVLHYAAWFTRVTITQTLLRGNGEMDANISPDQLVPLLAHKDEFGCNPLHYAIIRKSESITELILSAQSEVEEDFLNEKDIMGRSPFFYACLQKDAEEFVEYLLDEGANVLSTETSQQYTALHSALLMQNAHVIRALLSSLMDAEEWDVLTALLEQRTVSGYTCLHLACLTGHAALFQVLLSAYRKTRSDIPLSHLVDNHGRTLLHMAAFAQNAPLCRMVAKQFPVLHSHGDEVKRTALFYAVKHIHAGVDKAPTHGQESCLALLVEECQLDVHHVDMHGRTVLHYACHFNHLEQVRYLLSSPPDKSLDVCDHLGNTPLHIAATRGHAECVRLLILMGRARMDMQDAFGRTALHLSVQNKHSACAEVLVQLGADVSVVDHKQRTPLHYACAIDLQQSAISEYCAQVLLQDSRKELVTRGDCRGLSPLLMACATGNIRILRELLHHLLRRASVGVSADEPLSWPGSFVDRRGWSPMHYAAFHGHGEVLRVLLEYFRSIPPLPMTQRTRMIEWTDRWGMSVLHLASAYPSSSLGVKLLLDTGLLSPTRADRYGRTPLHLAAGCGNLSTCQILVAQAPSPAALVHAKDKEGRTPLDFVALAEESPDKLASWLKSVMESHPPQKESEVQFEPLPELPMSMRPQAISLHDTQPSQTPPRSTPRKMRKKSISNITMRAHTPRPHTQATESRPVRTPPARISFNDCASPEQPKRAAPPTSRPSAAVRSQTPARVGTSASRLPPTRPEKEPSRRTTSSKGSASASSKENQKPKSSATQQTTPRRKRMPLESNSSAPASKKRYQYSLSSHQNVFERLNAHAVARQQARKAREAAQS